MPGGTASGNKPRLESLQKIECGKGRGECEPHAMEYIGNEMGKGGWRGQRRLVGVEEEFVHVAGVHLDLALASTCEVAVSGGSQVRTGGDRLRFL